MLKQMKKTIGIFLAVCFLMSVTAAAVGAVPSVVKEKKTAAGVGAGPVMVKEKKTALIMLKSVKTKISNGLTTINTSCIITTTRCITTTN